MYDVMMPEAEHARSFTYVNKFEIFLQKQHDKQRRQISAVLDESLRDPTSASQPPYCGIREQPINMRSASENSLCSVFPNLFVEEAQFWTFFSLALLLPMSSGDLRNCRLSDDAVVTQQKKPWSKTKLLVHQKIIWNDRLPEREDDDKARNSTTRDA